MSAPEEGRRFRIHDLKPGQDVPCDGRIYRDTSGQLWFGLKHPLWREKHYLRLLRQVERFDRERGRK